MFWWQSECVCVSSDVSTSSNDMNKSITVWASVDQFLSIQKSWQLPRNAEIRSRSNFGLLTKFFEITKLLESWAVVYHVPTLPPQ